MKLYTFAELDEAARIVVTDRYLDSLDCDAFIVELAFYSELQDNLCSDPVARYSLDGSYGWPQL